MTNTADNAAQLIAELLSRRYLLRTHPRVKNALSDAELFLAVEQRLAQVGLRWVDNVYAEHVTLTLLATPLADVLGEAGINANNNLDLPRDAVALLVVLWALIVLPKRERQASRVEPDVQQNEMFASSKPLPSARSVSPVLSYKALLEDYGAQLGKRIRLDGNLKLLERHGFIVRSQDDIKEGPLLDLLLDYDVLAPRILNGALADVLAREQAELAQHGNDATTSVTANDPTSD
ncbi:MAG: hypothetical protein D4R79_17720 [Comamonadaceae bacterium]|jgi:hypothetical protein|nr:hypothetical protein [Rhodoferax sp.]TSA07270.1 MAG: hypothetical protein D4R79_17720 [Comamonadaceae bacterium]